MIEHFCDWLSATTLSMAFQNWDWFVPLVQTLHILSIAVVLTSVGMMSFRLIALSRGGRRAKVPESHCAEPRPAQHLPAEWIPWTWSALTLLLISGLLLIVTEPNRELLNITFRIKMLLVLVFAAVLLMIQSRQRRDPNYWTESPGRRQAARAMGIVCLVLGVSIVTAGRWIAYT